MDLTRRKIRKKSKHGFIVRVAELADASDLGSDTERCMGSNPFTDTIMGV